MGDREKKQKGGGNVKTGLRTSARKKEFKRKIQERLQAGRPLNKAQRRKYKSMLHSQEGVRAATGKRMQADAALPVAAKERG